MTVRSEPSRKYGSLPVTATPLRTSGPARRPRMPLRRQSCCAGRQVIEPAQAVLAVLADCDRFVLGYGLILRYQPAAHVFRDGPLHLDCDPLSRAIGIEGATGNVVLPRRGIRRKSGKAETVGLPDKVPEESLLRLGPESFEVVANRMFDNLLRSRTILAGLRLIGDRDDFRLLQIECAIRL